MEKEGEGVETTFKKPEIRGCEVRRTYNITGLLSLVLKTTA